jgi:hypothetical protein
MLKAAESQRQRGLAQTSLFEVCDAPKGHFKERGSALASMPDTSLREIADPQGPGSAPARLKASSKPVFPAYSRLACIRDRNKGSGTV